MAFVIDVQFVKDKLNKYIAKEVAVTSLSEEFFSHWIVTPPHHHSSQLPPNVIRQNNWLKHHHHGLDWHSGNVSRISLIKSLREICGSCEVIYVRGVDKKMWLQEVITNDIVDLSSKRFTCPAFHDLISGGKYYMQHGLKLHYLKYTCALNNASLLREWVIFKKNNLSEIQVEVRKILSRVSDDDNDE